MVLGQEYRRSMDKHVVPLDIPSPTHRPTAQARMEISPTHQPCQPRYYERSSSTWLALLINVEKEIKIK